MARAQSTGRPHSGGWRDQVTASERECDAARVLAALQGAVWMGCEDHLDL